MNTKRCAVLVLCFVMQSGAITWAQAVPGGASPTDPYAGGVPVTNGAVAPAMPDSPPATSHPLRKLFAGTIMAVLGGVGGAVVNGLVGGVGGSIQNWFSRRQQNSMAAGYPQTTYPQTTYPQTTFPQAVDASQQGGTYSQASTYPQAATYPPTTTYPPVTSYTPTNNAASGMPSPVGTTSNYPSPTPAPNAAAPSAASPNLVAGVAYEVHAQAAGQPVVAGQPDAVVDESSYVFHTGDRFTVYLRPSTPGRLEVYNINPLGQRSLIDSTTLAAGQLSVLGPYAFTATTGDEQLQLIISPCANPQLLATSRDIVNLSGSPTTTAVSLPGCSATRGLDVHTRDIQKVGVDGGTSFAIDSIAPAELAAGQITPRSLVLRFHHI